MFVKRLLVWLLAEHIGLTKCINALFYHTQLLTVVQLALDAQTTLAFE